MRTSVLQDNSIFLSNLRIDHPEVLSYLNGIPKDEWNEKIIQAIEIGTTVMARVESRNDIDYVNTRIADLLSQVETHFDSFDSQMKEILRSHLDPDITNSFLARANHVIINQSEKVSSNLAEILRNVQDSLIREVTRLEDGRAALDHKMDPDNHSGYLSAVVQKIDEFNGNLERQFSETDSASFVGKLKKEVDSHFGSEGELVKLIDEKLKVDIEGNTPLGQMFLNLKSEISSVRDCLMQTIGRQEIINSTTKKGYTFEDVVFKKLQKIAKPYSDFVDDTSTTIESLTGSKKGDYVYHITESNSEIVLDAKNYNRLNSLRAMLSYLDEAIKTRDSKMGILIAPSEESLQKQIGSWNVYDNKIITTFDLLEVSIKYARFSLRLDSSAEVGSINLAFVREKLEGMQRKLKEFVTIKSKLTKLSNGVSSSVSDIQSILDGIKEDINEKIMEIETEFIKSS